MNTIPPPPSPLALLLSQKKEALFERWIERVLNDTKVPGAKTLSLLTLHNGFPGLLDSLISGLGSLSHPHPAEEAGRRLGGELIGGLHVRQRLEQSYSLVAALRELSHFRLAIIELCSEGHVPIKDDESSFLHSIIDEAMSKVAVEREELTRQETERIAYFRERFISILGHDLKNPLTAITLAADFQLKHPGIGEKPLQWAALIAQSAERMKQIIYTVLDFAHSRLGGGIPISVAPTDLGDLSEQVVGELRIAYPDRSLSLEREGDLFGPWDKGRLMQAISNLVGNALEHGQDPIQVEVRGDEQEATIQVSNRGEPIPPSEVPRLFDPFRRGKQPKDKQKGLGLGLFILHEIVKAHQGAIEARSSEEEGTVFTIRLPKNPPNHNSTTPAK